MANKTSSLVANMKKKGYSIECGKTCDRNSARCWMNISKEKLEQAAQEDATYSFSIRLKSSYYKYEKNSKELLHDFKAKGKTIKNPVRWNFYVDLKTGHVYNSESSEDGYVVTTLKLKDKLSNLETAHSLLEQYVKIMDKLVDSKVSATYNNPSVEYAELLTKQLLGCVKQEDGLLCDNTGITYEVKTRRKTKGLGITSFGVIRKFEFQYLLLFTFEHDFKIESVYKLSKKFMWDNNIFVHKSREKGDAAIIQKVRSVLKKLPETELKKIDITDKFKKHICENS